MIVKCPKHDEIMNEYIYDEKIVPYCITCQSEMMLPSKLDDFYKEINRLTGLNFIKKISRVFFSLLGIILISLFASLFAFGWIAGMLLSLLIKEHPLILGHIIATCCYIPFMIHEMGSFDLMATKRPTVENVKGQLEKASSSHAKEAEKFKNTLRSDHFYLRKLSIDDIDTMSGEQFKTYAKVLLKHLGYSVHDSFSSAFVANKSDERMAVVCKRYTKSVPVTAVNELFDAAKYLNCANALLITTSKLSGPAFNKALELEINVLEREALIEQIEQVKKDNWDSYLRKSYNFDRVNDTPEFLKPASQAI